MLRENIINSKVIYLFDIESHDTRLIIEDFFVEDYLFAIDKTSNELIYSAYKRVGLLPFDEIYSYLYRVSYTEAGSKSTLIPGSKRMYASTIDPHQKKPLGIKKCPKNSAQIYEYRNKVWSPCSQFNETRPISITVHPTKEHTYAFLMQKKRFSRNLAG